jgi:preprotein translocase subunit SecA
MLSCRKRSKVYGKVYKGLGLTVGLVKSTSTLNEKKNELQF